MHDGTKAYTGAVTLRPQHKSLEVRVQVAFGNKVNPEMKKRGRRSDTRYGFDSEQSQSYDTHLTIRSMVDCIIAQIAIVEVKAGLYTKTLPVWDP